VTGPAPDNVAAFRSPRTAQERTQHLGMVVFLCAWAMLFCGLFLAYGVVRSSVSAWPPPGLPRPPTGLGALGVGLLGLSSGAVAAAVGALASGKQARAVLALGAALVLGGIFLALQAAIWTGLAARGLSLEGGPYADLFFVLTGFQALQLAVGEGGLFFALARTWRGLFNAAHMQPVRLWGMYWHCVTAAGCLVFGALYLA
jgi:heme/copper-type cytochrome/quinol oxidase subunit 3